MTKEQDKRIAVEIMGWSIDIEIDDGKDTVLYCPGILGKKCEGPHLEFRPTTDANDDCLVLKHIRENWDGSKLWIFDGMLISLWAEKNPNERDIELPKYYEKGDYSITALKVLDGQKTDKKPLSE